MAPVDLGAAGMLKKSAKLSGAWVGVLLAGAAGPLAGAADPNDKKSSTPLGGDTVTGCGLDGLAAGLAVGAEKPKMSSSPDSGTGGEVVRAACDTVAAGNDAPADSERGLLAGRV